MVLRHCCSAPAEGFCSDISQKTRLQQHRSKEETRKPKQIQKFAYLIKKVIDSTNNGFGGMVFNLLHPNNDCHCLLASTKQEDGIKNGLESSQSNELGWGTLHIVSPSFQFLRCRTSSPILYTIPQVRHLILCSISIHTLSSLPSSDIAHRMGAALFFERNFLRSYLALAV